MPDEQDTPADREQTLSGRDSDPVLRQAARALALCRRPGMESPLPLDILTELDRAIVPLQTGGPGDGPLPDAGCTAMLRIQAQVLDAVFNRLLLRAMQFHGMEDMPGCAHMDRDFLDFALRAQRQCRATVQEMGRTRKKSKNELNSPEK